VGQGRGEGGRGLFAALFAPPHALAKKAFAALCALALVYGAFYQARWFPARWEDMVLQRMPARDVFVQVRALPHPDRLGPFTVQSRLALSADDPRFGGLSGLALSGGRLTMVSDRGFLVRFRPDLSAARIAPLPDTSARRMRYGDNDSEDVALLADGRLAISFEGYQRVWFYRQDLEGRPAQDGPRLPAGTDMRGNGGLEAACLSPSGALYAGEEGPFLTAGGAHRFWTARPGAERLAPAFQMAAEPGWGLTACGFTPSGDMLVVTRFWRPGAPLRARLSVLRQAEGARGVVTAERLFTIGEEVRAPNLEGLSIEEKPEGGLRLRLVSDNNYVDGLASELWTLDLPAARP
jgi:hypothetical protein